MDKKLLSHDPVTGISKVFHADDNGDSFVIQTQQSAAAIESIIENNKRNFNDASGSFGNGKMVASIPLSIYWDLKKKGIADDPVAMKRWLNDPDNAAFRTWPGRV
jgi:hypothetical protein